MKLIKEIILPYVEHQRKEIGRPKQVALIIMDVFRGQITENVTALLTTNNIKYILVPANMTHIFQPLDLTVNKHCKTYLKKLFTELYAKQIENQLALGKKVEEITIKFLLSTMKPLHAKWLMQFYNEITSEKGQSVIINGWKAAGIYDALQLGSKHLPSIDPFEDISPLSNKVDLESPSTVNTLTDELRENFINEMEDEDSDWEEEDEFGDIDFNRDVNRNAFSVIIDDLDD